MTEISPFQKTWYQYRQRTEAVLQTSLNRYAVQKEVDKHASLSEAIAYGLLGGGKRLRPSLVYATGEMFNAGDSLADKAACAVEMIHCYSLIHDDMPEMDNDQYRRGKLSLHAKYGQATALLAGDNLQTLAFEILSEPVAQEQDNASGVRQLKMLNLLSRASGLNGMIGGQAIDLALENSQNNTAGQAEHNAQDLLLTAATQNHLNDCVAASASPLTSVAVQQRSFSSEETAILKNQLQTLHSMKTGALISASIQLGALSGDAEAEDLVHLQEYGSHLGLLFQITDDILDETSSFDVLGKSVGKDRDASKLTYTTLLGLDGAKEAARDHSEKAIAALEQLSRPADFLLDMVNAILLRNS